MLLKAYPMPGPKGQEREDEPRLQRKQRLAKGTCSKTAWDRSADTCVEHLIGTGDAPEVP